MATKKQGKRDKVQSCFVVISHKPSNSGACAICQSSIARAMRRRVGGGWHGIGKVWALMNHGW